MYVDEDTCSLYDDVDTCSLSDAMTFGRERGAERDSRGRRGASAEAEAGRDRERMSERELRGAVVRDADRGRHVF